MASKTFDSKGRLVDVGPQAHSPALDPDQSGATPRALQMLYVLAVASVFVVPYGAVWVSLAGLVHWRSMSILTSLLSSATVLAAALAVWRIAGVVRDPGRLDAPIERGLLRWCRTLALGLMAIGVAGALLQWIAGPLGLNSFARGGSAGGAGYFIAVWAAFSGSMNLLALMLFETSRLLGFEAWYREHRS